MTFPLNPTNGQTHTTVGGTVYTWNTAKGAWYVVTGTTISGPPPATGTLLAATGPEVIAGINAVKYVTPKALADASTSNSGGAGDAGKLVKLNASGKLNSSLIPNDIMEYKGRVLPTSTAPAAPDIGHVYVMSAAGTADPSWTGIGGTPLAASQMVIWDGSAWVPTGGSASVPDTFSSTGGTIVNTGANGSNLVLDVNHDVLFERPAVAAVGELAAMTGNEEVLVQFPGGVRQVKLSDMFGLLPPDVFLQSLSFNSGNGELTATLNDASTVMVDLDGRYVQTLNAIVPDAVGNVPLSLTAVETGTVAARPAAPADATIYVVSNNTADPLQNGKTFIYQTATSAWYEIVGYDVASMDARYINASGDTMAGQLILNADPTVALEAATKQYVDAKSADTFTSTGNSIIQSGANGSNLDLDVNVSALDALITDATAGEITALTSTSEIYASVGGVIKRIPLSAVSKDRRLVNAGAVAPTLRDDGTALVNGDLWYDTGTSTLKARVGAVWVNAIPAGAASMDVRFQAAAAAPTTRSDASALADGDTWYDTTANKLKVREAGAWVDVGGSSTDARIQAAAAAPTTRADATALADGDLWYDTTANKLKVREAGVWADVAAAGASEDPRIQAGASAPTTRADAAALVDGDLWYDTTANKLKVREAGAWVDVASGSAIDLQVAAGAGVPTKTTKADGTTALTEGDLLWNSTDKILYGWDAGGSAWVIIGSKWTDETGGISRADKVKVGGSGTPAAALDIAGATARNVEVTNGVMNLLLADRFELTVTADTTFSFANTPATRAAEVILRITDGGAFILGWPANVTWQGGVVPTLKTAGTDVICFWTHDGGTTWFAQAVSVTTPVNFSVLPASFNPAVNTFVDIPINPSVTVLNAGVRYNNAIATYYLEIYNSDGSLNTNINSMGVNGYGYSAHTVALSASGTGVVTDKLFNINPAGAGTLQSFFRAKTGGIPFLRVGVYSVAYWQNLAITR